MNRQRATVISEFTLSREQYISEIHADVYLFEHQLLNCPVIAIKNEDSNKTFAVAFNTIPDNSTGVAHILEHAVLMGSKKFPVKDVFGEINKGGLMTFLNAMTGSDITYYPFATRNLKEYFSLMDVYCDVVFNPLLLPETFEQEGWHYHKESREAALQFQGVVYNEMKGAFSDPIRLLFHHIFSALMPGSTYTHESGGDPQEIPNLSYQEFTEFHQHHYHPSNCLFFLYGDAPLEQELAFLNEQYLKQFPCAKPRKEPVRGSIIKRPVTISDTYGVASDDLSNKTFLAVGSHIGTVTDRERNTAFQIIANILFNSDGSPLKQRIISSGICRDFGGLYLSSSSYHTFMLTYLIGSEVAALKTFEQLYKETLGELVKNKIEPDLVIAEINKFEFSVREEMSKPQRGLDLLSKSLAAFRYGNDPFNALEIEALLKKIREAAVNGSLFEQLIEESLLKNPATVTLTLAPDSEKIAQTSKEEQDRLAQFEASLDQQQLDQLVEHTMALTQNQQQPNSDKSLACLPRLTLADLPDEIKFHQSEPAELFGQNILINHLPTNHITYLDLGFDFSHLPHRFLPLLDIFGAILTEIGTSTMDYMEFARKAGIYTGGISHTIKTYTSKDTPDKIRLILWVSIRMLPEYLAKSIDLLSQVFSDLSLKNSDRIREIIQRDFAWTEHAAQSEGYPLPATRACAHLSIAGRYQEQFNGVTTYRCIKDLVGSYQRHEEQLLADLEEMAQLLLNRRNLVISITAEDRELEHFKEIGAGLPEALSDTVHQPQPLLAAGNYGRNEGFITAAEVVFAVQAGSLFRGEPTAYNGSFEVLKTYLSRDYLWNTVRQMGGAYGCFIQFSHLTGNLAIISYRDPQVKKTYDAYEKIPEIIESLDISDQMLEQLIIGTFGAFDPHQSAASLGVTARNEYLSGIDTAFKLKRLSEIKQTTLEDLRAFAPFFQTMMKNSCRAIIGNRAKIEHDRTLFDSVSEL